MYLVMAESLWGHIGLTSMIQCYQILCFSNAMLITSTWSHPLTEMKLVLTLNSLAAKCFICFVLGSEWDHKYLQNVYMTVNLNIHLSVEVVKWYGTERFCLFLGNKSNESETCGLGLGLDDFRIRGLGLGLGLELASMGLDYISASPVYWYLTQRPAYWTLNCWASI